MRKLRGSAGGGVRAEVGGGAWTRDPAHSLPGYRPLARRTRPGTLR